MLLPTALILGGLLLFLIWLFLTYNRFVRGRNLMGEAWSGVDVQLKRRHDLVPNLVKVVQEYSRYERDLFQDVTAARDKCRQKEDVAGKNEAEGELTRGLKNLFAVAEDYPDLKADRQFLELQKHLVEVEDQIQLARRYYNGTVRNFNILIESFPSLLAGRLFGFKPREYFKVQTATERQNITI
jgi:LemA protein